VVTKSWGSSLLLECRVRSTEDCWVPFDLIEIIEFIVCVGCLATMVIGVFVVRDLDLNVGDCFIVGELVFGVFGVFDGVSINDVVVLFPDRNVQ
jgi:hypothetical protein